MGSSGGSPAAGSISGLPEAAQDTVGTAFADSATLDLTYDDAGNAIHADVLNSPLLGGQNSAFHRARANHTGTQTVSTISDLAASLAIPTGVLATTIPRRGAKANIGALLSGTQTFTAIWLDAGTLITGIAFYSQTTAAVAPTNQWFSLYSSALGLLRVTTDDTNTAWAANTRKALNLASSYTAPASGLFYLGVMVSAGTVPSLTGVAAPSAVTSIAPIISARDAGNSGLTNPASAPATAVFDTVATLDLYAEVF